MAGSGAGLRDHAWLELGPKPVRARNTFGIEGAFRMVGHASRKHAAFDTGWKPNCITNMGVWSILARLGFDTADITAAITFPSFTAGAGNPDSLTPELIAPPPSYFGIGTGTPGMDYFDRYILVTEVTTDSNRPSIGSARILSGPPTGASAGRTERRKVIMSALVLAEVIGTTGTDVNVTELGLFQDPDGPTLMAAASFEAITISADQEFTIFYSIGLSQDAQA